MPKRQAVLTFCLLIICALIFSGCKQPEPQTYSHDFFAMDTYITCKIVAPNQALAVQGLDRVEKVFVEIDHLTNRFNAESDIFVVNAMAGIAPVKVSEDAFAIVENALLWCNKSGGAFNILIGSVMNLWAFDSGKPTVPARADLQEALSKMDCSKIMLDAEQSTIFLTEKGMVIDLGGIAKGYATDKAIAALKDLGINNALINAGGNVCALGTRADGTPWKVGVQDPRDPQGIKAVLAAQDQALVSSGDYQRYFEVNGMRYHHILDPSTGYPARASAGTTVIAESATIADILSTALFIKGPLEGIEMAEHIEQVDAAMILTADGGMAATSNLKKYIIEP